MKAQRRKTKKELIELLKFMQKHLVVDERGEKSIRIMMSGKKFQNNETSQFPRRESGYDDINDFHLK